MPFFRAIRRAEAPIVCANPRHLHQDSHTRAGTFQIVLNMSSVITITAPHAFSAFLKQVQEGMPKIRRETPTHHALF